MMRRDEVLVKPEQLDPGVSFRRHNHECVEVEFNDSIAGGFETICVNRGGLRRAPLQASFG